MFWYILIFFVLLISATIFLKINKTTKKIVLTYLSVSGIILCTSTFNPNGLNNVSNYTYILWLLNVFFTITALLVWGAWRKEEKQTSDLKIESILKSKWFIVLESVLLCILILYKIKYTNIIKDLPTYEIRVVRFSSLFNNAFENLFFNYIIVGLVNVMTIIFAISLSNGKLKNISFYLMLACILVYTSIGYGRELLFNLFIYVLFSFIIQKDIKELFNWKIILSIIAIMLIAVIGITAMTFFRTRK